MKKIRLSQCMIVKNEEKNIRRALSWGKEIMYEQIVVDTGSTDQTVKIAEEMGAKVFHFEWIDDFSAAKNYAIEQASGDWIAFLDADEYFTNESVRKLISILKQAEAGGQGGSRVQAIVSSLSNIDKDGKPGVFAEQMRLFRNDPNIRYINRIHEALKFTGKGGFNALDARKELIIYHTGYTKDVYKETKKIDRNIRILEKELEDNPENAALLAYLGDSLNANGQHDKSKEYFHRALELGLKKEKDKEIALRAVSNLLVLYSRDFHPEEEQTVRELYQTYQDMHSDHPDADCYFGIWLYRGKYYEEATPHLKTALEKFKRYGGVLPMFMAANIRQICAQLADCCRRQGMDEEAIRYCVMSLGADRYYTEPLVILLTLLKKQDGENQTAQATWEVLSRLYKMSVLKDQITVLKGAKLTNFSALEARVYTMMPEAQRRAVQEALAKKVKERSADEKSSENSD